MDFDCTNCKYLENMIHSKVCPNCFKGDRWEPKLITNYDRIVRKSPEELAQWIMSIEPAACPFRDDYGDDCRFTHCRDCWLDWLKQEVTNA